MPLFFSIHPLVKNPPVARKQDISFLQYTYNLPEIQTDGLSLNDSFDFPFVNPVESQTHLLGAGFTNLVVQATFLNRRGKNRGRIILALGLTGVGTERFIECMATSDEDIITIFCDEDVDRIRVENQTEDGYSVNLQYGQGFMVVPPVFPVGVFGGTIAADFVNAVIDNNNLASNLPYVQVPEKAFVRRFVGPNKV